MTAPVLTMDLLPDAFGICRLAPDAAVPAWALAPGLASITRTSGELSIVCLEERVPPGITSVGGWRALRVVGTLDFALTGILAALAAPLAAAGVSIFALSTYDTDYLLVPQSQLTVATTTLERAGHRLVDPRDIGKR